MPLVKDTTTHSGQEPKFGQDVKCIDIYKGKDADAGKKRVDCLNYFSGRMGKSYIEGTAKFFYCDDNKGCNTPVGDDANLLKDQNPEIADKAKPADREIVRGGLNYYVEALKNAHLDPEQYCGFETRRQILIVGSKDAKCTFPNDLYVKDKPKFEALKNAFDQVQHPKETEVKIAKGNLRQAVEERILGMKMLSEACKNPALAKLMSEKYRMNVQSGKDAAAPKTVK
jgi:hypothetical protein